MGDFPDVDVRIKRPRNAFDHHHRALQQDQFGAGFHAKAFGHFEQVMKQPPHRNLRGIHAENRFAHSAQGLGKFIDILICRHITRLEMHFGHTFVIAPDEPDQDFGVNAARVFINPPHDAEIIGDDVAVRRHLQIALVHVGVEISVTQCMAKEQLQHPFAQCAAVMPCRVQCRVITQWQPVGPAQRHHPFAGKFPICHRNLKFRVILGVFGKFRGRRCLAAQI